jgi:hypothetical protein
MGYQFRPHYGGDGLRLRSEKRKKMKLISNIKTLTLKNKKRSSMKGVSYITDAKNRKKAVVIDLKTLKEHDDRIGDLLDVIIAESRRDEPSVSWEELKKRLKKKGKL